MKLSTASRDAVSISPDATLDATPDAAPDASHAGTPRGTSGRARPLPAWAAWVGALHLRWPDLLAFGVLLLGCLALVPQTVLMGKLPDNPDYWLQEFAHLAFLHRWLQAGVLPLWDPQLVTGTPHLADPQTAVLYPFTTLPLLLFSPALVARFSLPFHYLLAACFMYGYARHLRLSRAGATAAGLAYALAPHFAPLGNATYLQQSAAWVPAIAWALHRGAWPASPDDARRARGLWRSVRYGAFALAGLLWALQLFRGYPQTWYMTGLFAGGYLVALGIARALSSPAQRSAGLWVIVVGGALFGAVGLAAGAAQLLPSLALLGVSQRSDAFSLAEASGYGNVTLQNLLGVAGPGVEVTGAYPGGVVLGLALAALLCARGFRIWLHAGIAAVGLAFSLGDKTPLWALAYRLVPGFQTLHMPHRTLFIWSLGLVLLAGCGVDAIRTRPALRSYTVLGILLAGWLWLAVGAIGPTPELRRGLMQLVLGLVAVAILWAAGRARVTFPVQWTAWIAWGLVGLVAMDMLGYSFPRLYGQFYPPAQVYAPPPAAQWLQQQTATAAAAGSGPFRFASATFKPGAVPDPPPQDNRRLAYLPPNTPEIYPGLEAAAGYLAIRQVAVGELFGAVNELGKNPRILSVVDPRSHLLDLLGVRYFLTDAVDGYDSIVGGGQSLTADHPGTVLVRDPLPAKQIEIDSSLGDSVDVPTGEVVAEAIMHATDGSTRRWALAAGQDTAEWLYDAPGVAGTVQHRMAPVARSISRGSYQAHIYRATFDLSSLGGAAVREIELRVLNPKVRWNVDRVTLHTPLSARFDLVAQLGNVRIWENPAALPRAWWVGQYAVQPDPGVALETLRDPSFAYTALALLAQPVPSLAASALDPGTGATVVSTAPASSTTGSRVLWQRESPNELEFQVTAPADGLLVVSQTFASGWQAQVDGQRVPLYAADGVFQALPVPVGSHAITLRYHPTAVLAGAALSAATAVVLAAWAAVAIVRRRR